MAIHRMEKGAHSALMTARGGYQPLSQINVTPFVDVMLVLLIVFMVTAPLLTVGVQVDLPAGSNKTLPGSDEPLTLTVTKDGLLFIQESPVTVDELIPRLQAIQSARAEPARIFVRGDRVVAYGEVMAVMGRLKDAGFRKVALVTTISDQK